MSIKELNGGKKVTGTLDEFGPSQNMLQNNGAAVQGMRVMTHIKVDGELIQPIAIPEPIYRAMQGGVGEEVELWMLNTKNLVIGVRVGEGTPYLLRNGLNSGSATQGFGVFMGKLASLGIAGLAAWATFIAAFVNPTPPVLMFSVPIFLLFTWLLFKDSKQNAGSSSVVQEAKQAYAGNVVLV